LAFHLYLYKSRHIKNKLDSLTHIVLGACIGELVAGKQLGKKALIIGAVANSLPDIDFVASFFLPLTRDLLAHRGFTHSLLFIALASPLLSLISVRVFKNTSIQFSKWLAFWSLQMFVHIFIDAFNAYGTGWFEPFSHYRVSFNTMFVADPLFTIWPLIVTILLATLRSAHGRRRLLATAALSLSAVYLCSGIVYKSIIDRQVKSELVSMGAVSQHYFSTPTPLNNILWYIVAKSDSGFYIGYRSLFDKKETTNFRFVCQNASLLNAAENKEDIKRLIRFSDGFYTAELCNDTLLFNDLRFGEIAGWVDSMPHCVFYYYPQLPGSNELIVQRGRFAKWDAGLIRSFVRRIRGI
jgi:inner membrane protein